MRYCLFGRILHAREEIWAAVTTNDRLTDRLKRNRTWKHDQEDRRAAIRDVAYRLGRLGVSREELEATIEQAIEAAWSAPTGTADSFGEEMSKAGVYGGPSRIGLVTTGQKGRKAWR
jgi:hypothetical protein